MMLLRTREMKDWLLKKLGFGWNYESETLISASGVKSPAEVEKKLRRVWAVWSHKGRIRGFILMPVWFNGLGQRVLNRNA